MSKMWHRIVAEVRLQSKTSLPAMVSMLLYKVPWLVSLKFVGSLGSTELAAAALATTLCNVTGMSLSVGLSSAMTTLAGQARGDCMAQRDDKTIQQRQGNQNVSTNHEEKKDGEQELLIMNQEDYGSAATRIRASDKRNEQPPLLPITILIRGIFIQLLLVIPVGLWWLSGIKPTLIALGQGEELSSMTQQYLRILTPGLWAYSINWTLTSWLQAIEMADVPVYAATVGLLLHIPLNFLFIYGINMDYLGAAVATVMFQLIQPIVMVSYLFCTNKGVARVLENTIAVGRTRLSFWKEAKLAVFCVSGIRQYLRLALPGIIIISEWWASEICIFLSGRMIPNADLALDGMTIYQSINTFCFMLPMSMSIAGSTRVGNFLGAGNVRGAELSAKVSVASAALLSSIMGCLLYCLPHTLVPSFFSPDKNVVYEASRTIPLLALYLFADGVQVALNGVIKGCGRQCITMPVVVVAYWLVGVPLAYDIAFVVHEGKMYCEKGDELCGITGLVFGLTCGTWVHMLLLLFIVVFTTNWKMEAQRAKERLAHDKHHKEVPLSPVVGRDEVNEMGIMSL